jgi:hypothetical protein
MTRTAYGMNTATIPARARAADEALLKWEQGLHVTHEERELLLQEGYFRFLPTARAIARMRFLQASGVAQKASA